MNTKISTLNNGLRIITQERPNLETVSIGIWVKTGSACENEHNNGISHFLEHMSFKGTNSRTALQITEEIEDVGGQSNAYTSRECTAYYAKMMKEDAEIAADVLIDSVKNSIFPQEELIKERDVVVQEIKQTIDTPDDIVFDYFQETAFPKQALGRSILGPIAKVKNFSREDLLKYISTNYAAENMAVCAVGNIKHDDFVNMVAARMSDYKAKVEFVKDKQQYQGGFCAQRRDIEQSHVLVGFKSCSYKDPHHCATVLLSAILGGGMSSRLFQEIREKRGLVYSVYSFNSMFSETGLFGIYAGTEAKDVPALMPVVADEIKKICNELVTEKEFIRAKTQIKAGLKMGLESSSSTAEVLSRQLLMYDRTYTIAELVEKYEAVTLEDIRTVALEIFSTTPTYTLLGAYDKYMEYDELQKALA
ncbi:MAG: insulinase family protein [Alphaproteobacteria bacterium]|nr:insulinase family protein [Alphaproteobacteria bacterium]